MATAVNSSQRVVQPWKFTVDDYHRMGEVGILHEDDRVELIEGEILAMSPIGSRHVAAVARLDDLFAEGLARRATRLIQSPVRVNKRSEPQPDLVILKPRADYYASKLPEPDDVLLLIEVMDSSADYDREVKLPMYALAGIPEVWLVDLNGERIEVYRRPTNAGYAESCIRSRGEALAPEAFADLVLKVDEILG